MMNEKPQTVVNIKFFQMDIDALWHQKEREKGEREKIRGKGTDQKKEEE